MPNLKESLSQFAGKLAVFFVIMTIVMRFTGSLLADLGNKEVTKDRFGNNQIIYQFDHTIVVCYLTSFTTLVLFVVFMMLYIRSKWPNVMK